VGNGGKCAAIMLLSPSAADLTGITTLLQAMNQAQEESSPNTTRTKTDQSEEMPHIFSIAMVWLDQPY